MPSDIHSIYSSCFSFSLSIQKMFVYCNNSMIVLLWNDANISCFYVWLTGNSGTIVWWLEWTVLAVESQILQIIHDLANLISRTIFMPNENSILRLVKTFSLNISLNQYKIKSHSAYCPAHCPAYRTHSKLQFLWSLFLICVLKFFEYEESDSLSLHGIVFTATLFFQQQWYFILALLLDR